MRRFLTAIFVLGATAGQADVPRVATDIAPVQSLVATVMGELGTPDLIIPPAATPHSYAMRPSEARALAGADLVVWVGPSLTGWLDDPIKTLAPDAVHLALQDVAGTVLLENRGGVAFETHAHDGSEKTAVEVAGDDTHDTQDAGAIDPHLWLDPVNGARWLGEIAEALAAQDPENAGIYRANAARGQADLSVLEQELRAQLEPLRDRPFIVFHDAYHYFEARFEVEARAAISLSDGAAPSAARLTELGHVIADTGAVCVFTEPQFNGGLIRALQQDKPLKSAELDPLGARVPQGAALYSELLSGIAAAFVTCLSE